MESTDAYLDTAKGGNCRYPHVLEIIAPYISERKEYDKQLMEVTARALPLFQPEFCGDFSRKNNCFSQFPWLGSGYALEELDGYRV
ncbi:hypothetical protein HB775_18760 [Rhizobium leguminosarum bv. trifolii]|nr:hypothetical protein HB775_18760 [Rhizobium leguminosarum bv. trifolii]